MKQSSRDRSRRSFLAVSGLLALHEFSEARSRAAEVPITGLDDPNLKPFDQLMTSFVETNRVPGASLAVTRNGKLVYARGFGYADVDAREPVAPTARFRIASVSKPITAVGILQLVEQRKLHLDDRVITQMKLKPFFPAGATLDPRWESITVRDCLQHTGGWDRSKSYDPIGRPKLIANTLNEPLPVSPTQVVRYMMGQPLDFNPGERHAYSNLGYLILGRIIEAISGQPYETYIKRQVLAPLQITSAQLGRGRLENRAKGEVRYYDGKNRMGPAVLPPRIGEQVPFQYGAENFDGYEAHGGWIASAVDLVKFASAFDDSSRSPLLSSLAIEAMWARPEGVAGLNPGGKPRDAYYGCGWMVRPVGNRSKRNAWHTGFITGTEALLVRRWDGLNWAVLFNTSNNPDGKGLVGLIDGPLHIAADEVKHWPDTDQFPRLLT